MVTIDNNLPNNQPKSIDRSSRRSQESSIPGPRIKRKLRRRRRNGELRSNDHKQQRQQPHRAIAEEDLSDRNEAAAPQAPTPDSSVPRNPSAMLTAAVPSVLPPFSSKNNRTGLSSSFMTNLILQYILETEATLTTADITTSIQNATNNVPSALPLSNLYRVFVPTEIALFKLDLDYLKQLATPDFELHLWHLAGFHVTANRGDLNNNNNSPVPDPAAVNRTRGGVSQNATNASLTTTGLTTTPMQMFTGGSILLSQCHDDQDQYLIRGSDPNTTKMCLETFNYAPSKIVSEAQTLRPEDFQHVAGLDSNNSITDRDVSAEVYSIDNVLLPEWATFNLLSYMESFDCRVYSRYSTFRSLWVASGMDSLLRNANKKTLLAPDNAGISIPTRDFLLRPDNVHLLRRVLAYHVLTGIFNFRSVIQQQTNGSLPLLAMATFDEEDEMTVKLFSGSSRTLTFNNVTAVSYTVTKTNVLYRVEQLLIPPSLRGLVPDSSSSTSNGKAAFERLANKFLNIPDQLLLDNDGDRLVNLNNGPFAETQLPWVRDDDDEVPPEVLFIPPLPDETTPEEALFIPPLLL